MKDVKLTTSGAGKFLRSSRGCTLLGEDFTVIESYTRDDSNRWTGRIEYKGNSTDLFVEKVHFPVASMEFPAEGAGLLVGVSQGWVYNFKSDHSDGTLIEGNFSSLQMSAVLSKDLCTYFDFRDTSDLLKGYRYDKEGQQLTFHAIHPLPCDSLHRTAWNIDFDCTIARFPGGWYEAAQLYRSWALKTPHYQNRIRENPQRDIAIWLWNRGGAEHVIVPAEKLAQDSGVPVALDWYWWHHNPYDTDYPDFWPPREGEENFRNAIARLKQQKIYCQVYVNGLTWDVDLPDYQTHGLESAVVDRDGNPYSIEFNCYTHHRLGYMCGEGEAFHKRLQTLVGKLVKAGLPGVYLDMIGCAANIPCYNPRHNHAPGGGNYHATGYWKLVADLRRTFPNLQLSTECCNETFLDCFDSVIVLSSSMERCCNEEWIDCVPLFSAVYHGATAMFGNYALPDGIPPWDPLWPPRKRWQHEQNWDEVYPEQFYLELARTVNWGMQPTVCNFQLKHTEGRFKKLYEYMINTARFYYANREFLYDGRMLHPGDFHCATRKVGFLQRGLFTTEEKHTTLYRDLPAVLHSRWESPHHRQALIMLNYTSDPQTCTADGVTYQLKPYEFLRAEF